MRHIATALRHRGPARAGLLTLRATAAAAVLLGTMTVGLTAAGAQADEDAGSYESPTFGYTLEWDAESWSVEADTEASDDYPRDLLRLSDADGTTALFVEASEEDWSDTDDCVAGLFDEIQLDPADGEAVEDENGDPFEVSEDDRSLAAYIFPIEIDGGDTQDQVRLVECRADPDSDLIVGFTGYSGIVDAYAEDGYPLVEEIADSLSFVGDATPKASRRGGGAETPEASTRPSSETGIDGNAYLSPTYGYQLEWDEDVWTVEDEASEDDVDSLTLSSDLLVANITGYNSGDGDTATCLENVVDVLNDRGAGDAEILIGDDGDPIGAADDTDMAAQRLISYSVDGDPFGSFVTCVSLDDERVLAVEFTAAPEDLLSEEATGQISDVLDTLAF